jgi:hypothetical protein
MCAARAMMEHAWILGLLNDTSTTILTNERDGDAAVSLDGRLVNKFARKSTPTGPLYEHGDILTEATRHRNRHTNNLSTSRRLACSYWLRYQNCSGEHSLVTLKIRANNTGRLYELVPCPFAGWLDHASIARDGQRVLRCDEAEVAIPLLDFHSGRVSGRAVPQRVLPRSGRLRLHALKGRHLYVVWKPRVSDFAHVAYAHVHASCIEKYSGGQV